MNYNTFLFLLFTLLISRANAQEFTLEEKNNTGRDLYVYKTDYYPDSTKAYGSFQSPKGTSGGLLSELRVIRIDYIAIDAETKDTVCKISALENDLKGGLITFNIGKNTIIPPYQIEPRLRIKGKDYRNVLKKQDPIEIKLISNKKIAGNIVSYSKEKITILSTDNQEIEIKPKDIKGIKSCKHLIAYGARVAILKNCKYSKTSSIKFAIVEQKFNEKERFWDWVEIK